MRKRERQKKRKKLRNTFKCTTNIHSNMTPEKLKKE